MKADTKAVVTDVLDAHVHVWDPRRMPYPWLSNVPALDRPMLPDAVDTAEHTVTGAVFIEADCGPDHAVGEARWVMSLDWPQLRGIVAGADLRAERLESHLDALAEVGRVVGVRHPLQGEDVEHWSDDGRLLGGLRMIAERGWTFDACVRWTQLDALADLLARVPQASVVLDHLGKPPVTSGPESPEGLAWEAALTRVADRAQTFIKLSGLAAEADHAQTLARHGDAFLGRAIDLFGAERAMIGSDWPVSRHLGGASSTANWIAQVARVADLKGADWTAIASGTAERFYGLGRPQVA
jgi:L-fuconolactonase